MTISFLRSTFAFYLLTLAELAQAQPVKIAVIDSGVLHHHPSLQGKVLPGFDMVSGQLNLRGGRSTNSSPDVPNFQCTNGFSSGAYRVHGTEVSSLISGNGAFGVQGVARDALVVPVRVMSACGMSRKDLVDSIAWVAGFPITDVPKNQNPVKIINLSFTGGNYECSRDLQQVIDKVTQQGVFVVAAAGNTFQKRLQEPANCLGVISVGSVDHRNRVSSYSALDERINVYVKRSASNQSSGSNAGFVGVKVATFSMSSQGSEDATVSTNKAGTSFSAAIVSGLIANQLTEDPTLDYKRLVHNLTQLSTSIQGEVSCPQCRPRVLGMSYLNGQN